MRMDAVLADTRYDRGRNGSTVLIKKNDNKMNKNMNVKNKNNKNKNKILRT